MFFDCISCVPLCKSHLKIGIELKKVWLKNICLSITQSDRLYQASRKKTVKWIIDVCRSAYSIID